MRLGPDQTGLICKQSSPEFWDRTEVRSHSPVQSGLSNGCHGTSFPLTEGLSTSPHLPRYLSDRSHDLWTVYIARPLWPLLVSFPLYAKTVLSPKSYSSPRDTGVVRPGRGNRGKEQHSGLHRNATRRPDRDNNRSSG